MRLFFLTLLVLVLTACTTQPATTTPPKPSASPSASPEAPKTTVSLNVLMKTLEYGSVDNHVADLIVVPDRDGPIRNFGFIEEKTGCDNVAFRVQGGDRTPETFSLNITAPSVIQVSKGATVVIPLYADVSTQGTCPDNSIMKFHRVTFSVNGKFFDIPVSASDLKIVAQPSGNVASVTDQIPQVFFSQVFDPGLNNKEAFQWRFKASDDEEDVLLSAKATGISGAEQYDMEDQNGASINRAPVTEFQLHEYRVPQGASRGLSLFCSGGQIHVGDVVTITVKYRGVKSGVTHVATFNSQRPH